MPEVGGKRPVRSEITVDLPAPFGPSKPKHSLGVREGMMRGEKGEEYEEAMMMMIYPRSMDKESLLTATIGPLL